MKTVIKVALIVLLWIVTVNSGKISVDTAARLQLAHVDVWHGDAAWGARYHVTSIHLLMISLIAIFIERILSVKRLKR